MKTKADGACALDAVFGVPNSKNEVELAKARSLLRASMPCAFANVRWAMKAPALLLHFGEEDGCAN